MLSSTQTRLKQQLKDQALENSWKISKVFVKFLDLSLKDIGEKYNRTIRNIDELLKIPGFNISTFTKEIIKPILNSFITLEQMADPEIASARAVKLTQLMKALTDQISIDNDRKLEIYLLPYLDLCKLPNFAQELLYNHKTISPEIKTRLHQSFVSFSQKIREKPQIVEKDQNDAIHNAVLQITCGLYKYTALYNTEPLWTNPTLDEIEAELEKYKTFIKKTSWEKNKKSYYREQENYLFCMSNLYIRKKDFESSRYYLLSMLQNAKRGFAFDHAFSDDILRRIHNTYQGLPNQLTKENIFSTGTAEEILFISRIMKELINKSIALQAKKVNEYNPNWNFLSSQKLNELKNYFSACIERIKALSWLAIKDQLSKEDKELIKLGYIDGKPFQNTSAVAESEFAKNTTNCTKNYTLTAIDPDFLPYLCRALKSCEMSYLSIEQPNIVRITNFYPYKIEQFPSALQNARLSYQQDKQAKEETVQIQVSNSTVTDNEQEKLNLPEVKDSTVTETSSSLSANRIKKEKKPKNLSAKAEAIISQNQKTPKRPDVSFTDTLKYCDNSEENNVYPLRATKAHHIYATIDPALKKELESKKLDLPLEDLTTMLDVGHVLNNSKGLRGSILSGKPFKNEKQPTGKGLYVKVKNCSHDFRFFGYKTHEKVINDDVTCTLVTINGWKEKHNKKSELFASVPEQLDTKVKKSNKKKNNKKRSGKKKAF